jgi:hypothetical protein
MGCEMITRAAAERERTGQEYPKAMVFGFPPLVIYVRSEQEEQQINKTNNLLIAVILWLAGATLVGFVIVLGLMVARCV